MPEDKPGSYVFLTATCLIPGVKARSFLPHDEVLAVASALRERGSVAMNMSFGNGQAIVGEVTAMEITSQA